MKRAQNVERIERQFFFSIGSMRRGHHRGVRGGTATIIDIRIPAKRHREGEAVGGNLPTMPVMTSGRQETTGHIRRQRGFPRSTARGDLLVAWIAGPETGFMRFSSMNPVDVLSSTTIGVHRSRQMPYRVRREREQRHEWKA